MESEITVMAQSFRKLFLIMDMVDLLTQSVVLTVGGAIIKISTHEYNMGSLVLSETLSPQLTPYSKHYATKTI